MNTCKFEKGKPCNSSCIAFDIRTQQCRAQGSPGLFRK
jgi:hypothetical protein